MNKIVLKQAFYCGQSCLLSGESFDTLINEILDFLNLALDAIEACSNSNVEAL